ncbi:class I SAM-dependent methyltransferase [Kallotenue papyrolyticum]|uniref:class I SAM-dependent methyltransferase n=1 Tax=Kallotenue papyrolyticum TaxID=1325125 RepID=UPI0005BACBD4|nr:class I SAM-dependent methyltransferase [Kallotenue papyrolyticum]
MDVLNRDKSPSAHISKEEIKFGEERVSHLYKNDLYYAHLSIYRFAVQFIRGGYVLDAGSGAGYGSAYFADHGARFVWGIEVSPEAVAFSQQHFKRPNLQFQVMDLQNITGFEDHSFDLIFSSNVLEHIPNVMSFLHSAWRLLKPDGVIVIAVPPISSIELQAANIANPYHLNIWSPRQWHCVFNMYFSEIGCYLHNARNDIALDFGNTPGQTIINEHDFTFDSASIDELSYKPTLSALFVLRGPKDLGDLASDRQLTFIDDSFSIPEGNVELRKQAAQRLLSRAQDVQRLLSEFVDAKDISAIPDFEGRLYELENRLHDLEMSIAAKNEHIIYLENLIKHIEAGTVLRTVNFLATLLRRNR